MSPEPRGDPGQPSRGHSTGAQCNPPSEMHSGDTACPVITWQTEPELQIRRALGNPLVSELLPVEISAGEVQGVLRLRDYPGLVTPGSHSQGHKDV